MDNIIEFKTRSKLLKEWLKEVIKINALTKNNDVKSAIIMWETKDKNGNSVLMHAKYNCGMQEFEWMRNCMDAQVFNMKMDEYLKKNIGKYIEYIE
jgi:hypothetical protein